MESIGRFEIRKSLGHGAQSVVYLGFDPHLQREVALKTLRVDSAEEARQLLAEARAMSALRHPNIVPVFEAGESRGQPHLVFEYVPGGTLADLVRDGPLTPERAVALMLPVLDALAYAHDRGLVHRDVKPTNILLSESGQPRLMDFGVAARVAKRAGEADHRMMAGTPAYMAPEYIEDRVIQPSIDVFAAGLVLLELLTGHKVIDERDIYRTMYRLTHEDIRVPETLALPEKLADAVNRAVARRPALRWQSAREFRLALENALAPSPTPASPGDAGSQSGTLEFLLRRMRLKSDFPALSGSISAVNRIAGGAETENNAILAGAVLKDVALTNKILRVVNSAVYRQHGGPVSTVSRAVMILGFEAVRNLAVALLLIENLQSRSQAEALREEFLRAMLAALMARSLGQAAGVRNIEEAFICALFHDLGRMLALLYLPEEAQEIRRLATADGVPEAEAAHRVLGLTYETLGMEIARVWGFPDQIVQSQRRLPDGPVHYIGSTSERVCVLAALSDALACAVAHDKPRERHQRVKALAERFGEGLKLSERHLESAIDQSLDHIHEYAATFNLTLKKTALGAQIGRWRGDEAPAAADENDPDMATVPNGLPDQGIDVTLRLPEAGLPENAANILAAGIQDVSNSLVADYRLNDLLRMILETMYRGVGFKRVLLAVMDVRTQTLQGRLGFGPDVQELAHRFRFRMDGGRDVFQLVLTRGVDLLITDVSDPNIRDRIPAWHRQATPARTFALFPMVVKDKPVALIYAEHDNAGGIVIPEHELGLLRTLRNQAVLAIKQTS